MRIAIISALSTQYNSEMLLAVERAGMVPVLAEKDVNLVDCEGYILDSFENSSDQKFDSIIQMLKLQSELSKPILGISQGAEMLVKSGLVPGIENDKPAISVSQKQENDGFMRLSDNYQYNAFTRLLSPDKILNVSSAGRRRFVIPPALFLEMEENGLNVFRSCDAAGKINPNEVAAVSNKAGNVMAIMPGLEYTTMTDTIFSSMKEYIAMGYKQRVKPLYYYPR